LIKKTINFEFVEEFVMLNLKKKEKERERKRIVSVLSYTDSYAQDTLFCQFGSFAPSSLTNVISCFKSFIEH